MSEPHPIHKCYLVSSCRDCPNRLEMHLLYKPYGMMVLPPKKESYDFMGRWVCSEKDEKEIGILDDLPIWCPLPCASHSSAPKQDAEQRIRDVIKELERRDEPSLGYGYNVTITCREAIALLRKE